MHSSPVRRWWRNLSHMLKDRSTAAVAAALSASLALMLSWLGDGLLVARVSGSCIAYALTESPCQTGSPIAFLVLLALIVIVAISLYRWLRRRMPVEVHGMQPAIPRAVLMMCISRLDDAWRLTKNGQGFHLALQDRTWELGTTFDDALTRLNSDGSSWPWHQLLRGIGPHRPALRQLVLLTTSESRERLVELKQWLSAMLPNVVILECPCTGRDVAADANSISKMIKTMSKSRTPERQQIIDISGANKVLSIAATLATLDNDCTFQYVRAEFNVPGNGEVLECYSSVASSHE